MNKKVDNKFIPKFVPNDLKWYEPDGLNTWSEQMFRVFGRFRWTL